MGKISTSLVKTSFSKNNTNTYKLSILCGVDSLSYCISNSTKEVLVLKKFDLYKNLTLDNEAIIAASFEEIWKEDPLLSFAYMEIHIAFVRPHYTLIPNKLYQAKNKAAYLSPLKANADNPELYQVNDIEGMAAKLIFSLPQAAVSFFESKFPQGVKYYNSFTPLINGIEKEMERLAGKHVWINIHPNVIQIIFFDGKELIFSNQFPFETEKDFLYYIMLVYSQFKLNPEEIPLHISGQLVKESAVFKSLYRYIRNVSFLSISDTYQLNTHLTEHPSYFYFDLLAI